MTHSDFCNILSVNKYQGKYGYNVRDVDNVMRMKTKDIIKKYKIDQLNELCGICGICKGSIATCKIGEAIHLKDKDEVDICGEAKYNMNFPEI